MAPGDGSDPRGPAQLDIYPEQRPETGRRTVDRVRRKQPETNPEQPSTSKTHLPLRWAVILLGTSASGFAVEAGAGLVAGVSVAIGVAGVMHKILP